MTIPAKLKPGDKIMVIAPSRSMSIISEQNLEIARKRFADMGLEVVYSEHVREKDEFNSSSIASRLSDIHQAFADKSVKMVITVIGGFNSNQLLRYLDYKLIKNNPKIFCGFSDITALSNAIFRKTGLVTYSGPHYSTFGMRDGCEYVIEYFKKCFFNDGAFEVLPSEKWSDDAWYLNQDKREFLENQGYQIINEGSAEGEIIGGNAGTFNLLQGTEYLPDLKGKIVFWEDDDEARAHSFDRDLQSFLHQKGADKIKGLVIGRFQKISNISRETLEKIIKTKKELENIPVIAQADFGHTSSIISFPIGGRARIEARGGKAGISIPTH
jgi:muramoyltetrapeptide carboxypeptidase LdcA involved in peptidoglycan recycling